MVYIASIIAFLLGVFLATASICTLMAGKIVVNIVDIADENPYLTAELDRSVGFISKRKYVLFKVDVRDIHTQN